MWTGITLCYIILAPIGLANIVKLIILGSVSFLVMAVSNTYKGKNWTILVCTAVTGSGMMMDGVGAYAGGFPSLFRATHLDITDLNGVSAYYWGYVIGWIVTALLGACNQRRIAKWLFVKEEWEDPEDQSMMLTRKGLF